MGRRKCTPKQLAALKRGREIAHRRSKKTTNGLWNKFVAYNVRNGQKQASKLNSHVPLNNNLRPIIKN